MQYYRYIYLLTFNFVKKFKCDDELPVITAENLIRLKEDFSSFMELNIQNHHYYVQDEVLCPFPFDFESCDMDKMYPKDYYNDVYEHFKPFDCQKPWYWTREHYQKVSFTDLKTRINEQPKKNVFIKTAEKYKFIKPINRLKLGNIVDWCIKQNESVYIQCYALVINVIESAGLTFIYRFFEYIKAMTPAASGIIRAEHKFLELLLSMKSIFQKLFISTHPIECVIKVLEIRGEQCFNFLDFKEVMHYRSKSLDEFFFCVDFSDLENKLDFPVLNPWNIIDHLSNNMWDHMNKVSKIDFDKYGSMVKDYDLLMKIQLKSNEQGISLFQKHIS